MADHLQLWVLCGKALVRPTRRVSNQSCQSVWPIIVLFQSEGHLMLPLALSSLRQATYTAPPTKTRDECRVE